MKRFLLVIATLLSLTVLLAACKKNGRYHRHSAATNKHPHRRQATPAPTEATPL